MKDALTDEPAAPPILHLDRGDPEPSAKRRKVRKGTRSCWECKRRKIRCIFASPDDAVCTGCQHRHAPCVSQDVPEDPSAARKGSRNLGERVARVEDFINDLVASQNACEAGKVGREPRPEARSTYTAGPARTSTRVPLTPAESLTDSSLRTPDSRGVSAPACPATTALQGLWAAFPVEKDAQILLQESTRPSLYTEFVNLQPHSKLTLESLAAPSPTPSMPGPHTHPVILARQMLMFAITLQSPCGEKVRGLSEPSDTLMRRLVTAVSTWVTTKDDMHGTIDSLVCIMLEGVFEINSGNLRRAWAVYRRAMTAAQLMGLHRASIPPLKRIDPELDADPEFMWFRIVYMDRYLSLLLGLPQGTTDTSMGAPSVVQHEPPLGQFERRLTVLVSAILERNGSAFTASAITTTQSIDAELLTLSRGMPATFWRPANFHSLTPGSPEALLETVRLAAQVYYYGLLIQLHLPYMMHGISHGPEHDYAKMTCVNASREIVARFIAHRTFNPMSSCSRPVDFFALLAAMTLLLAHLDAHHDRQVTNVLAHQRLSDRAMLDQALGLMHVMSSTNEDVVARKSAELIQRLLEIEADAADGSSYTTRSLTGGDGSDVPLEDMEKKDDELRLRIPYLGVIKITCQDPVSCNQLDNPTSTPSQIFSMVEPQPLTHTHNTALGSSCPGNHVPARDQPRSHHNDQSTAQYACPGQDDIALQAGEELGGAGITAGAENWTFQGVDMAFFDSLMRGMPGVDAAGLEE